MLDAKVCRTCHKSLDKKEVHSKLDEVDPGTEITLRTKLHVCVPEMMLGDSNEDVICMICNNMLNLSYMFRNICIKTEQTRHNSLPRPLVITAAIKKEREERGYVVTRLNPTPSASNSNSRASSNHNAVIKGEKGVNTSNSENHAKDQVNVMKSPRGRPKGSRKDRKGKRVSRSGEGKGNSGGVNNKGSSVEDRADGMDGMQEPLLEVAYEESVSDASASDDELSSLSLPDARDVAEVFIRDPNTNTAPGGRTLRTRHSVSYAIPDSPETVRRNTNSSRSRSSAANGGSKSAGVGAVAGATGGGKGAGGGGGGGASRAASSGAAAAASTSAAVVVAKSQSQKLGAAGKEKEKEKASEQVVTRGRDRSGGGGGGSVGGGASGGGSTTRQSSAHRGIVVMSVKGAVGTAWETCSITDVDVIDDFCRRENRDPLEFKCSVPVLKCDADMGPHAPPHGVLPWIDSCVCDICGRALSAYTKLRAHRMRHFGAFMFACSVCRQGFYDRYEVRKHLQKAHKLAGQALINHTQNSTRNTNKGKFRLNVQSKGKLRGNQIAAAKEVSLPVYKPVSQFTGFRRHSSVAPVALSSKPGPKSSKIQNNSTIVTSKPGPKSSKVSEPVVKNKPGPKSSKNMSLLEEVTKKGKSPKKNNSSNNVKPDLKRRRMSIGTPSAGVKRKKTAANTSNGQRYKYECAFCNVLVPDRETLRVHLKSYHCNVCYKFFVGKSVKNAHHCLHVPQKVQDESFFLCLDCDDYKSKHHFLIHIDPLISPKVDNLFNKHPRPTFDSTNANDKARIQPTITCTSGKNCQFFCGDPDALNFHLARVHGLSKLLRKIPTEKLSRFELQDNRPVNPLDSLQLTEFVDRFVDVEALDTLDNPDLIDDDTPERCGSCLEEMPRGPLEHECAPNGLLVVQECARNIDDLYKCEICLRSFDRLSLIEHMKVHMNM